MKKHLIKFMLTALMFGLMTSFSAMAADSEANSNITISEGNISLMSENAEQDGITGIQLSLKVETDVDAEISFNFNPDFLKEDSDTEDGVKVAEVRYHEDEETGSKIINIYIANSEPVFKGSNSLNLGAVSAIDTAGNNVEVKITVVKDSLKFVSQNNLTEKTFNVEGTTTAETSTTEIPKSPAGAGNTGGIIQAETTTTTTTAVKDNSFEVEKEFAESYKINIPDSTDSLAENHIFTAGVENVLIEHGQTLKLSVTSEHSWELTDKYHPENNKTVGYSIGYGDAKTAIKNKTETILTVGEGKKSDNVKLTVIEVKTPELAGTFADTLTFSVEIS